MSPFGLTRTVLIALALVVLTDTSSAQPPHGTEFWFAYLENYVFTGRPPEPTEMLRVDIVAADLDAQCRVEIPGAGWSADITLAAGTAGSVIIPVALAISLGSEAIESRAIHVIASSPVTVTAINHMTLGLGDATVVLPVEALGRDYVAATYDALTLDAREYPSELIVVSVEDSTVVEITPAARTLAGRAAGNAFTVMLHRGQTYQVQSHGNLSGTRVRTVDGTPCDRIAVFAGNLAAQVDSCNSIDHLYEQMLPIASLEREYLAVPFASRPGGDVIDVVAIEDSTLVLNAVGPPTMLNAGGRYRMRLTKPSRIAATKPIAVVQYSRGRECDRAFEGDPHSVQLRPLGVASSIDIVAPGALTFNRHFITVVVPTSMTATARIDGAPIVGFVPFADLALYSWAQVPVTSGGHRVTGSGIASLVLYGSGEAISYAVDASAARIVDQSPSDIAVTTRCTCDGVLLEAPAGFSSYRWSTGDSTRTITVRASGLYSVTAEARGCTVVSAQSRVVVSDARASIAMTPSEAVVAAGDVIPLTIITRDRNPTETTCRNGFDRVALRFRSSMLAPAWIDGASIVGDSLSGEDRIITLELDADTVLLDMTAAFGDTVGASIVLAAIGIDSCMQVAGDTLAHFAFDGCEVDGRRMFLGGAGATIKPVRPLPVRGAATIEYRTLEPGHTRLELLDATARLVTTLASTASVPGDHVAQLDASGLPAGMYILVLRSGTRDVSRVIVIE